MHCLPAILMLALVLNAMRASLAADASFTSSDASREAYTQPIAGLNEAQRLLFLQGRNLVRQVWVVPPSENREIAGLGPLYNRISCTACHAGNGRGFAPAAEHEAMRSMLVRLSMPGTNLHGGPMPHPLYGDQLNENGVPGVPGEGRAVIRYTDHMVTLNGGEHVHLRQPRLHIVDLAYGTLSPDVCISSRIALPIFGLGLLQAVPESTIVARARAPKPAGINGKVNRVWDEQQQTTVLGRFGWKANMPNLNQQIAGAFIGDMGITSPMFPHENCTSAQTACKSAPSAGEPELSPQQLQSMEFYHLALAVPRQRQAQTTSQAKSTAQAQNAELQRGAVLFKRAQCAACHLPQLKTGKFTALPALSEQLIYPYTDLLLHDMGEGLADHRPDFLANGREWRTPPLWGIGLSQTVEPRAGFLHDGRARSLLEAVLWHGGEGAQSAQAVQRMPKRDRHALIKFLESL